MGLEHYAGGSYLQGTHNNVIGKLTGTTNPDEVYIIGGHFDHIGGDRPGGDDNASGTAGVLEAARVMSQYEFESTILFMCFNAEEDGLLGAWDFVDGLTTTQKSNIKGMTNLDMILRPGRDDVGAGTIIDVDLETRSNASGSAASITWSEAFQLAATNYVPSVTVDATIWSYPDDYSDHAPFTKAGMPAVLVIENSGDQWPDGWPAPNNIYYHGYEDASDRLANDPCSPSGVTYDYAFATDVVRVAVALTAQTAGLEPSITDPPDTIPPTPNPAEFASAPSADNASSISMTATTGTDVSFPVEYLFTETSGNSGGTSSGWQISPGYTDSGLAIGTMYTYTVTMRDASGNTGTASAGASATTDVGTINVVLPSNGGVFEETLSDYTEYTGYGPEYLTNGITSELGWSREANPASPQEFVYSFSGGNSATLGNAVIHGGNPDGNYYCKDVEVLTSNDEDGASFTSRGSDMLDDEDYDSVTISLVGVTAKYVKLKITSGYSSTYWELAEFEVNGNIIIP